MHILNTCNHKCPIHISTRRVKCTMIDDSAHTYLTVTIYMLSCDKQSNKSHIADTNNIHSVTVKGILIKSYSDTVRPILQFISCYMATIFSIMNAILCISYDNVKYALCRLPIPYIYPKQIKICL